MNRSKKARDEEEQEAVCGGTTNSTDAIQHTANTNTQHDIGKVAGKGKLT